MSNPIQGGWSGQGFVYNHQASLTTAWQTLRLSADGTNAPLSTEPADVAWFDDLWIRLDTIAGGATSVEVALVDDANGDEGISPPATQTIQTGATTATDGWVAFKVDRSWFRYSSAVSATQRPRVNIRLNAGTARANIFLSWRSGVYYVR